MDKDINALDKVSIEFYKLLNLQLLAVDSYNRGFISRSLLASLLESSLIDLNYTIDKKRSLWPEISRQEIKYKLHRSFSKGFNLGRAMR